MTFTLLVVDREHGLLGAVTASRSLAVGNAVIAIDPAVGVVASQAWTNRTLRHRLLTTMAEGADARTAVDRIPEWDDEPELRQAAALDLRGGSGAVTGAGTTGWAGHRASAGAIALGNLLTGPEVLDAMRDSFRGSTAGPHPFDLARRLLDALRAGEDAGGDSRGRQSAALLVARVRPDRQTPPAMDVDLRVDDHVDPVGQLARLLTLQTDDRAVSARTV